MAALLIAMVGVTAGTTYIDLTTAGATVTDANGGVWIQGGIGAGTGNFDPFLTLSTNAETEKGVNVCDDPGCPAPQFDTFTGGGRTHELLASAIPQIYYGGELYREFSLDANDQGNDDWMSVDNVEIYLSTNKNLTDYPFAVPAEASLVYSMPLDTDVLMRSQTLSPGSGVSDITLLVPDTVFPDECYYGSQTCDLYVFFYTESGFVGEYGGQDYDVTAGFEEWRVSLQPVVDISKTVDITFDRTYAWDIQKMADVESIDLFAGDTASIDWTVTVTGEGYDDSNIEVSGEIEILNPTGPGYAISDPIPAIINSVTDVMTLGGDAEPVSVSCPVTFPYTLDPGDTLTCTYTASPDDTDNGTNTATANIVIQEAVPNANPPIAEVNQDYSFTEDVDFADAVMTEVDECIDVSDDNATPGVPGDDLYLGEVCVDDLVAGEYTFPTFSTDVGPYDVGECGSGSVTNRAEFVTNDTETTDYAEDTVLIECYELTVEKTAETSLTRTWTWDVAKSADVETIDLFAGDTADIDWTIVLSSLGSSDSAWHVQGDITITNPAPIPADDVAVSDVISGFAGATNVDCNPGMAGLQGTVDIPADDDVTCTYWADLPNGTTRTNTATATLFEVDYIDTASVDFSGATVTDVDECIDVVDDNATPGDASDDIDYGTICLADLDVNDQYTFGPFTTTVGPFDTETCGSTTVTNTVYTETGDTSTDDSASDSVDVACYELTVTKDATTSLDRDWDWTIAKTRFIVPEEIDEDGDPSTLTINVGQTYLVTYHITVNVSGSTDSNWAVEGTITIDNPAPMIAEDVDVADEVSGVGPAQVDCDLVTAGLQTTVDVPAEGSAECSYSLDLPDGTDRTNTATATLFEIDYDGDADVLFDESTVVTEIDECIDVIDDNGTPLDLTDDTPLGTVCADDVLPHTFTNTILIGPFAECGPYEFTNTASFTTSDDVNDTTESDWDSYTIYIDVPCEGCTLTPGYWKTHNDSFWGGAPTDETWELLGDADGDGVIEGENEEFFLSGQTYFEVLWTPPAGNVYYNLAFQYIAAELNMLSGADPSAITMAFADATDLFETYTPAQVAELKGKNGKELRAEFIYLAGILGQYNEGYIGPGHCDEDPTSASGLLIPPLLPIRRRWAI